MGLETAAIVMAGVAVASEVGKSVAQVKAAESQGKALELQALEKQLETQQKTLSNYDVMEKVLDAQIAHQTITGTAFSSPSFNAIQRQTLNIGSRKQKNIDIEGELAQENIKLERQNVKTTLFAQLFGNTAQAATAAFSIYSKMPQLQE
jgi:hypothetical protein